MISPSTEPTNQKSSAKILFFSQLRNKAASFFIKTCRLVIGFAADGLFFYVNAELSLFSIERFFELIAGLIDSLLSGLVLFDSLN